MDKSLYQKKYEEIISAIEKEIDRSNEDFICHYFKKYNDPKLPPAWMTLEVLSLGSLSVLYSSLNKSNLKKRIAQEFGLPNFFFLENWMHSLSILRNCCAHHTRIWNRRFTVGIKIPNNTLHPFIDKKSINTIRNNKLFIVLCCIKYILNIISPNSDFKNSL